MPSVRLVKQVLQARELNETQTSHNQTLPNTPIQHSETVDPIVALSVVGGVSVITIFIFLWHYFLRPRRWTESGLSRFGEFLIALQEKRRQKMNANNPTSQAEAQNPLELTPLRVLQSRPMQTDESHIYTLTAPPEYTSRYSLPTLLPSYSNQPGIEVSLQDAGMSSTRGIYTIEQEISRQASLPPYSLVNSGIENEQSIVVSN